MNVHSHAGDDGREAPWVSLADLFLLTTVLLIAVCAARTASTDAANIRARTLLQQLALQDAAQLTLKSSFDSTTAELRDVQDALMVARQENAALQPVVAHAEEMERTLLSMHSIVEAKELMDRDLGEARTETSEARAAAAKVTEEFKAFQNLQGVMNQELLGLQGRLDRVVFVFDRSGSMRDGDRWSFVKRTMQIWLQLLPVREASIVVFNDKVESDPPGNSMLPMTPENRQRLLEFLNGREPGGPTNTDAALRRAYEYERIDAIILFSDGEPDRPSATLQLVRQMAKAFPGTRIHAVGLGDYFHSDLGDFLNEISSKTGGAFIGR